MTHTVLICFDVLPCFLAAKGNCLLWLGRRPKWRRFFVVHPIFFSPGASPEASPKVPEEIPSSSVSMVRFRQYKSYYHHREISKGHFGNFPLDFKESFRPSTVSGWQRPSSPKGKFLETHRPCWHQRHAWERRVRFEPCASAVPCG